MTDAKEFDVIIIGGSYAGLSAAMALGRALRKVLVVDSGKPCNIQTPHSHNFLTQDGKTPREISSLAREQVAKYPTVTFLNDVAVNGHKTEIGFEIQSSSGDTFKSQKLILATGIADTAPNIQGFSECWGISILHCPYCHGYEVKNEKTGILANGDVAFEFSKMIYNWTKDLTLFTNGRSTMTNDQTEKLSEYNVKIVETEIERFEHNNGTIQNLMLKDNSKVAVKAIYAKIPFVQHSNIPAALGCELTEQGHIKVDMLQKTSVPGVFACGDNASPMRSVASAVSSGSVAGAMVNKELIDELFAKSLVASY